MRKMKSIKMVWNMMINWLLFKEAISTDPIVQSYIDRINKLNSIYEGEKVPFCYPGTYLDDDLKEFIGELIRKNFNLIGAHTHSEKGEGGFEDVQAMERWAVRWISNLMGDQTADGYFAGGGTEGNIMGMWIAREYLKHNNQAQEKKDFHITAIVPETIHYSVLKAFDMLGIIDWVFVKNDSDLLIDMDDLRKIIDNKSTNGTTSFIIVGTSGICISGGNDPITEISDMIDEYKSKEDSPDFYFHVDAAFAGFTVPFLTNDVQIGFRNKNVFSMVLDGHKMGLIPYPSGIFMCRKGFQEYVTRDVHYIRGGHDDTISGSRSAIGPVSAWYMFHKYGFEGYQKLAQDCITHRDILKKMLTERNIHGVRILKCDPYVNFMPVIIDIKDGKIPEKIEEEELYPYHMRSDKFMIDGKEEYVYKVCVMRHTFMKNGQHTLEHFTNFINDIENIVNSNWHQ